MPDIIHETNAILAEVNSLRSQRGALHQRLSEQRVQVAALLNEIDAAIDELRPGSGMGVPTIVQGPPPPKATGAGAVPETSEGVASFNYEKATLAEVILHLASNADRPLTSKEIIEALNAVRDTKISAETVYSTLFRMTSGDHPSLTVDGPRGSKVYAVKKKRGSK